MTTTFTIKQIPAALADRLRARAENNHRSLQRELLLILEEASQWSGHDSVPLRIAEPAAAYRHEQKTTPRRRSGAKTNRLSLEELWARSRKLGAKGKSESADIIRRDRDAHHHR